MRKLSRICYVVFVIISLSIIYYLFNAYSNATYADEYPEHLNMNIVYPYLEKDNLILITGTVKPYEEGATLSIEVFSPNGILFHSDKFTAKIYDDATGLATFEYTFAIPKQYAITGYYKILAVYELKDRNELLDNQILFIDFSNSKIQSPHTVKWGEKEYDIEFDINNGAFVREIKPYSLHGGKGIFILLDQKGTKKDATLNITIPMHLIIKLFGYAQSGGMLQTVSTVTETEIIEETVFVLPQYTTTYNLITSTFDEQDPFYAQYSKLVHADCKSVSWNVKVPRDTYRIDLDLRAAGFFDNSPYPADDNKFPLKVNVTAAGETLTFDVFTNANKCDFIFSQEEKKLHVDLQTIEDDEKGFFRITMPHRLLGGNYTVLVDGKPSSFKIVGTGNDLALVTSSYQIEAFSVLAIEYDKEAKSIDIIGTTAIPEFGPAVQGDSVDPPLVQFKSGIAAGKIKCKNEMQLIIKSANGSPACVKPETAEKLVQRGWART